MKYIVGGIALVLVVVAFIAIIISLVFRDSEPIELTEVARLSDVIDGSSEVILTTYGKIVALEDFRAIRISVTDSTRMIEILSGYDGSVIERLQYANTNDSYGAFIHALDQAGYTNTRDFPDEREDGYCPTGRRYVFELLIDNQQAQRTWSSTCRGTEGNFAGNRSLIENLFKAQIPEYRDITRPVRL
ncbi:hypothetical protein BH23PAT2_BH23PAT2_03670 [soil metagenome]